MQSLSKWIFKRLGWRIVGSLPTGHDRLMMLLAPHTSNWDFVLAIMVKYILNAKVHFAAKKSLFRGPFDYIFSSWGGIPVDRSEGNTSVQQIIDFIKKKDRILFAMAPEGSRKKVEKLKSGFYRIAKEAKMKVHLVSLDYGKKELRFGPVFSIEEKEKEEVISYVTSYYKGVKGKIQANSFT